MERSKTKGVSEIPGARIGWKQAVVLLVVWLALSGKFDPFHLIVGVAGIGLILFLDRKLGRPNLDAAPVDLATHYGRLLAYIPWLGWQMVLSAWQVAKVVIDPSRLEAAVVRFRSPQPHTVARVMLANSITLTPGTLTLHLGGDTYLVHAISRDAREGLVDGSMQAKVARVFRCEMERPVVDDAIVKGRIKL